MAEKEKLKVGDVIPIQQVVGFRVIKKIIDDEPVWVDVEKQFEAEVLSSIFKEAKN